MLLLLTVSAVVEVSVWNVFYSGSDRRWRWERGSFCYTLSLWMFRACERGLINTRSLQVLVRSGQCSVVCKQTVSCFQCICVFLWIHMWVEMYVLLSFFLFPSFKSFLQKPWESVREVSLLFFRFLREKGYEIQQ